MKIVTILGARPQFIKAAPVSRTLRHHGCTEYLVHTGQHYDHTMSGIFFDELGVPSPDANLGVGSGSHGRQTGKMLAEIEMVLLAQRPDWVLIYGDTNSTLAGALAAAKLQLRVAHVEAGLRSYNRTMPEETNRVVADHLSDLLLCPSQAAMRNLATEGIIRGVYVIGDVMMEALAFASNQAVTHSRVLERLSLAEKKFLLATAHRAENVDNPDRLQSILNAFEVLSETRPVVFPVHPRTRQAIQALAYQPGQHVHLIEPVGYLDMVRLEQAAALVLTDSGGIQKEAYWLGVPCVTLREETEWTETVCSGWNVLAGASTVRIVEAARRITPPAEHPPLYGDGQASERCVQFLESE